MIHRDQAKKFKYQYISKTQDVCRFKAINKALGKLVLSEFRTENRLLFAKIKFKKVEQMIRSNTFKPCNSHSKKLFD